MKLFASTSPSYLTLMSLDYANKFLSAPENIHRMNVVAKRISDIKSKYGITTSEPYKIAVRTAKSAEKICETQNVEPEYVSDSVLLFMFSGLSSDEDLAAVDRVLSQVAFADRLSDADKNGMLSGLGYNSF
jgi:arginine/lysine/ornithine decarboxylase